MADITRGRLAGAIGMTHPMAKLVVMLLLGVFGGIGVSGPAARIGDRGLPGPVRIASAARGQAVRRTR